jgi:ligand-binding sensor domain-containing protein/signal transduction histidine kinase
MDSGRLTLFVITLLLPVGAAGQSARAPQLARSQLSVRVWEVRDGLPQNQVRAVRQTRDGYLWVATYDGLARFDGVRFAVFNRENTPALPSNIFTSLCEGRDGALWAGSDGGLVRFRGGEFFTFTTARGLSSDMVGGLAEAPDGALLVAAGNALHTLRGETISRVSHINLPAAQAVRQVYAARSGDVWLATNRGALRLAGNRVRHYTARDGLGTENLTSVGEDRQGNLWFGTVGGGLIRYDGARFEGYPIKPDAPDNIVYAIAEDGAGRLWAGTHGGLYRLGPDRMTGFARGDGLPSDFVTALWADREGSLWVGTDGGGLAQVRDAGARVFNARDGLAGDSVRSIVEDARGVWFASWFSDRLSLLGGGEFKAVGAGHPLLRHGVRAMLADRGGALWLAVADNRLVSLRGGVFKDHTDAGGPAVPIFALAEDERGRLWLGRSDGLVLYEDGKFTNRTAGLKLPAPGVRVIIAARGGGLWVGTESGLLRLRDDGSIQSYTARDGLPYPFVAGLYEDADGSLWVGTRGGGLSRFKDGSFESVTMKQGLPSDEVYQMLEDDRANLWCGSSRGVFRVSRRELNQFFAGEVRSLASVSFGHADGLQNPVHFGTHPSACRTRDGRLWFPTLNGAVMIEPERLSFNPVAPLVAVEQVVVDKQAFGAGREVVAPPGRGEVEIHYAGLSFVAPERVAFRYRLEGYEDEWVEAGARRTAYYTNLPPGDYVFRVLAANGDGVWAEAGAAARFRLRPHFYQTWSFYAACALALAGLAWLAHKQRVRQIHARHAAVMAERNRIARNIHDTLAQEVAGLLAQLHVIKTLLVASPQTAARHVERAVELARTGLADARRLVLDLRHQALEQDDLAAALENFVAQFSGPDEDADDGEDAEDADRAQPRVSYRVSGAPRRLAAEHENNLLRIGQESVTNALRHAAARSVEVTLSFEPKAVELRVRDDGRGFDPGAHAQGFGGHYGLLGIRERAAQIGGELSLSSSPGAGTEIKVRVRTG